MTEAMGDVRIVEYNIAGLSWVIIKPWQTLQNTILCIIIIMLYGLSFIILCSSPRGVTTHKSAPPIQSGAPSFLSIGVLIVFENVGVLCARQFLTRVCGRTQHNTAQHSIHATVRRGNAQTTRMRAPAMSADAQCHLGACGGLPSAGALPRVDCALQCLHTARHGMA